MTRPSERSGEKLETAFRRATRADREAILAVSALFPEDWIPYVIDAALGVDRGGFFVAERGGRVIAVCSAHLDGEAAWLQAMRVDPAFQNAGVATALTRHVLDSCRAWGCRYARLSTSVTNRAVHHFIGEKLGFMNLGRWVVADNLEDWEPFVAAQGKEVLGPAGAGDAETGRTARATGAAGAACARANGATPAGPQDAQAVWRFVEARSREGRVQPPWLVSPPGDPWRVVDLTPTLLSSYLRAGGVLTHASGGDLDGVVLCGVFPFNPSGGETEGGPGDKTKGGPGDETKGGPADGSWAQVAFLEGSPTVAATLLAAALATMRARSRGAALALSLPRSQWETLMAVARPGWPPGGPALDAFIYHKDLAAGVTGGAGAPGAGGGRTDRVRP